MNDSISIVEAIKDLCPPGKFIASFEAYESLQLTKRLFRPFSGLEGHPLFVLSDRLITNQDKRFLDGLSIKQKMAIPHFLLNTWDALKPDKDVSLATIKKIFEQPTIIVLGETSPDKPSPIVSTATSDAVGIMEILSIINSNNDLLVGLDHWEDTADMAMNRHIVLIGSGMVNTYSFALNDIFHPLHFMKTQGRCLDQIVATSEGRTLHFGSHAHPPKNSSLVLLSKNPFNVDKYLLWIAGISGVATQVAYSFVKDLIVSPKTAVISGKSDQSQEPPIACVVGPDIRSPATAAWTLHDYYGRLRIPGYKLIWAIDRQSREIL